LRLEFGKSRTADRQGREGDGNTWWTLFAGEEISEALGTWRRAAVEVAHPVVAEREGERERARAHGGWHWEERRRLVAIRVTCQ
jgi:hypothetical protein